MTIFEDPPSCPISAARKAELWVGELIFVAESVQKDIPALKETRTTAKGGTSRSTEKKRHSERFDAAKEQRKKTQEKGDLGKVNKRGKLREALSISKTNQRGLIFSPASRFRPENSTSMGKSGTLLS